MASGASPTIHIPNLQPLFKTNNASDQKQMAPTSPSSPTRGAKSVQPRVFARLQSLFPPSFPFPQSPASPASFPSTGTPLLVPPPPSPQFLKTRIITWNMHESLPKGNLEELLGSVPSHTPRDFVVDADRMRIPGLSMEEGHPYHIIVVAGQECPTLSGIPLGLAANFKHKDAKDREKEKLKEKDIENDGGNDKDILHQTKHRRSKYLKHEHASQTRLPNPPHDGLEASSSHNSTQTSGWSAILEDWFANGAGSLHDIKPVVTGTAQNTLMTTSSPQVVVGNVPNLHKLSQPSSADQLPESVDVDWKRYDASASGSNTSVSGVKARTGPYELLVKERLMGIYTAVYIHRDVRSLVRGFSTGVVPAGLIGGRLGNKGGVGVSIDIHGTTLLFINAHLAAHEGKVPLRVANLAKIKAELPLESWLAPDDPRTVAEDITDRFDHSWIFGDLNFRLDVSRLHADWLISRKEYAQAFEFDQLYRLMESGEGTLAGFNEAKIDFPPTFKYDVMRSLKREKHKLHQTLKTLVPNTLDKDGQGSSDLIGKGDPDDEALGEVVSLHSSTWTSIHSRHHTDNTEDGDDSDTSPLSNPEVDILTHSPSTKLVARAASKAKETWLAFVESSRDLTKDSRRVRRPTSANRPEMPGSAIELPRRIKPDAEAHSFLPVLRRAVSAKTPLEQQARESEHLSVEDGKGVYDSSSKKRVPSWCDRILWKTTVDQPEELPDSEVVVGVGGHSRSNRVGQLFLQAFRPRTRRESVNSDSPEHTSRHNSAGNASHTMSPPSLQFKRPSTTSPSLSPGLYQSKSLEPSPSHVPFDGALLMSRDHPGLHRSPSASPHSGKSRRQSLPVYPHPSRALPTPRRVDSDKIAPVSPEEPLESPVTSTPRVVAKRWFFNLLSRDQSPLFPSVNNATTSQPQYILPPQPRKGDVVCLSYRTLDDQQMRRLEGRSDHRPVIGSFAIHI